MPSFLEALNSTKYEQTLQSLELSIDTKKSTGLKQLFNEFFSSSNRENNNIEQQEAIAQRLFKLNKLLTSLFVPNDKKPKDITGFLNEHFLKRDFSRYESDVERLAGLYAQLMSIRRDTDLSFTQDDEEDYDNKCLQLTYIAWHLQAISIIKCYVELKKLLGDASVIHTEELYNLLNEARNFSKEDNTPFNAEDFLKKFLNDSTKLNEDILKNKNIQNCLFLLADVFAIIDGVSKFEKKEIELKARNLVSMQESAPANINPLEQPSTENDEDFRIKALESGIEVGSIHTAGGGSIKAELTQTDLTASTSFVRVNNAEAAERELLTKDQLKEWSELIPRKYYELAERALLFIRNSDIQISETARILLKNVAAMQYLRTNNSEDFAHQVATRTSNNQVSFTKEEIQTLLSLLQLCENFDSLQASRLKATSDKEVTLALSLKSEDLKQREAGVPEESFLGVGGGIIPNANVGLDRVDSLANRPKHELPRSFFGIENPSDTSIDLSSVATVKPIEITTPSSDLTRHSKSLASVSGVEFDERELLNGDQLKKWGSIISEEYYGLAKRVLLFIGDNNIQLPETARIILLNIAAMQSLTTTNSEDGSTQIANGQEMFTKEEIALITALVKACQDYENVEVSMREDLSVESTIGSSIVSRLGAKSTPDSINSTVSPLPYGSVPYSTIKSYLGSPDQDYRLFTELSPSIPADYSNQQLTVWKKPTVDLEEDIPQSPVGFHSLFAKSAAMLPQKQGAVTPHHDSTVTFEKVEEDAPVATITSNVAITSLQTLLESINNATTPLHILNHALHHRTE
jgi:hypothetical protein